MRILIIRNYPTFLDVKNNTYNIQEVGLAKALVRKGHCCDIVFWTNGQEEESILPVDDNGKVTVYYRKGTKILKNAIFKSLDSLIEQYDLIQPCEYNQIYAWYLSGKYKQKTIIYHGTYYSRFNKRYNMMCLAFDLLFLKRYIHNNTKFMVKSALSQKFLMDKGIKAKNISVVGVGIDADMLCSDVNDNNEYLYQEIKKISDGPKILYVGRIEKRRNPLFLVDVFAKVYEKDSSAKLYIVGTGDESCLQEVNAHIQEKGLEDKVVWQPKMEQKYLAAVYEEADYFLLPTEYEIFGMVMLEAMYHQTIVLTTPNGGSDTVIEDGKSGIIFTELNAEKWADSILGLWKTQAYDKISKQAANVVQNGFTWDALVSPILECYMQKYEE